MATILAVDDDPKIRELLTTVLGRKGHRVLCADSGRRGLELFRDLHPEVTILDVDMPEGGMDGLSVLREIRMQAMNAPVIILTGAATEAKEREARRLGATAFLTKGFSLHELGAALRPFVEDASSNASYWTESTPQT